MMIARLLTIVLLAASYVSTEGSTLRIVDASGAPFPNVLVIVKSLDGNVEIGRYLTDKDGRTPRIGLNDGVYRLITTCPYGICRTQIREFLGSTLPPEATFTADVNSSDISGEIVAAPMIRLMILNSTGDPAKAAQVLVRDQMAKWEHWYSTDNNGVVRLELVSDPSVLVIVYDSKLISQEIGITCGSKDAVNPSLSRKCLTTAPGETTILRLGTEGVSRVQDTR